MSQLLFIDAVEIMPVGISHQLCNLIDFHVRVHIQASGLLHPEPGYIVDKIDAHDLLEYPAEIIPADANLIRHRLKPQILIPQMVPDIIQGCPHLLFQTAGIRTTGIEYPRFTFPSIVRSLCVSLTAVKQAG